MGKPIFAVRQSRWILARCPCNGEEVVGSGWHKSFSLPSGYGSWWYCPACFGWHVVMGLDSSPEEKWQDPEGLGDQFIEKRSIKPTSGIIFIRKHEANFLPEYL
jgi:hypothetical protein